MSDIPYSIRGTSSVTRYSGFGTNNAILTSNGTGAAPTWNNTIDVDEANIDTIVGNTADFTGNVTALDITTSTANLDEVTIDSLGCDTANFSGNVSFGGGLISTRLVSVGTAWVDVPNTQPRGAYLILARSEDDNDSALVAAVSDNSDSEVGYINVLARKGDTTTNYYLALQYPSSSNVQIKMSNGNTRNVSIMVIRA